MSADPAVSAAILTGQNRQAIDIPGGLHINGVSVGRLWISIGTIECMPKGIAVAVNSLVALISWLGTVAGNDPAAASDGSSQGC
jgi:hypothetical protein